MAFFRKGSGARSLSSIQVGSSIYGKPIPFVRGQARVPTNAIWAGDLAAVEQTQDVGKGGGSVSTGFEYFAAVQLALCGGPVTFTGTAWIDKDIVTATSGGFEVYPGDRFQQPWGYMVAKHPLEALAYRGLSYMAASNLALGNAPRIPNVSLEVRTTGQVMGSGVDASPAEVVRDFIDENSPLVDRLDPDALADYASYVGPENGLWMSPCWFDQKPVAEYINMVMALTNSAAVAGRGVLRLVPYRTDTAAEDIEAIRPDELLSPVRRLNVNLSDAYNVVKLECFNREYQYNADVVEISDRADIEIYGRREPETITAHAFCDKAAALRAGELLLQRSVYVRQKYQVRVGIQRSYLEPMDLVRIPYKGRLLPVRILSVSMDENFELEWECEEYVQGTGTARSKTADQAAGGGFSINTDGAAGVMYEPYIFQPPLSFTITPKVYIAVAGDERFGGAEVWASINGQSYKKIGQTNGNAKYGLTISPLPAGLVESMTPDETLLVETRAPNGAVENFTVEEEDGRNIGLLYVDGEIILFRNEAMEAANAFRYSRLYRGYYGSPPIAHAGRSPWARLNQAVFVYPFDIAMTGRTVFIKLVPLNIFGRVGSAGPTLEDVTPYEVVLGGGDGDAAAPSSGSYAPPVNGGDAGTTQGQLASQPGAGTGNAGAGGGGGMGDTDFRTGIAFEALDVANPLVYVRADGQIARAFAGVDGNAAQGYIRTSVPSGATATVYFDGVVTGQAGLSPRARLYLSDTVPGAFTTTPIDNFSPDSIGKIHQFVGRALSATTVEFEREDEVLIQE